MQKLRIYKLAVVLVIAAVATGLGLFGCSSTEKKPKSGRPEMVQKVSWRDSLPSGSFRSQVPERITLLHNREPLKEGTNLEAYMKALQQKAIRNGWGDLGAHYYVGPLGEIYQGRATFLTGRILEEKELDPTGHIFIMLLGDYNQQKPTEEMKLKLISLILWLCKDQSLMLEDTKGLNEYVADTESPGWLMTEWLESDDYQNLIKLAKGIPLDTPTPTASPTPSPTPLNRRGRK